MQRSVKPEKFEKFKKDFKPVVDIILKSKGELDFRIRPGYFNIYYKGNSLAKIEFSKDDYKITISKKFSQGIFDKDKRFADYSSSGEYNIYKIESNLVHAFFQIEHINKLESNIKKVNYSEELIAEQMILTDNRENEDVIILDKQINDTNYKGRMDLLALKRVEGSTYQFYVIEVKMGNNLELSNAVHDQITNYIDYIAKNIDEWKTSYLQTYYQLMELGLHPNMNKQINVTNDVSGVVVSCGYSGLGAAQIEELKKNHPKRKYGIVSLTYKLITVP